MFDSLMYRLQNPMLILLSLPAIFIGFTVHEFAHAFVADRLGDPTPRNMGRVTLNPLVHIDWIGLVLFIGLGFGWAKPVMVNSVHFKNQKTGNILVSLAGVIANFLCAFVFFGIYALLANASFAAAPVMDNAILPIVQQIVWMQMVLFFFNLLPIPPLDGYQVVKTLVLRRSNAGLFWQLDRYGVYALYLMMIIGLAGTYISICVGWMSGFIVQFYRLIGLL